MQSPINLPVSGHRWGITCRVATAVLNYLEIQESEANTPPPLPQTTPWRAHGSSPGVIHLTEKRSARIQEYARNMRSYYFNSRSLSVVDNILTRLILPPRAVPCVIVDVPAQLEMCWQWHWGWGRGVSPWRKRASHRRNRIEVNTSQSAKRQTKGNQSLYSMYFQLIGRHMCAHTHTTHMSIHIRTRLEL